MRDMARVAEGIAWWLVAGIVALIPLFILPVPWAQVDQSKTLFAAALLSIALLFWIVSAFLEKKLVLPKSAILVTGVLLPIAYTLSAFISGRAGTFTDGLGAVDTVAVIILLYLMLLLAAAVARDGLSSVVFFLSCLISGIGVAVVVEIARLFFPSLLSIGGALSVSGSTLLGSAHDLAIVAALAVLFAVALAPLPMLAQWWRTLLVVVSVLALVPLVAVNASDVWFALSCGSFMLGAFRWVSAQGDWARRVVHSWIPFAVGGLALCAAAWGSTIFSVLPPPLHVTYQDVRPSWQGTFAVGAHVFSGSSFVFGSGPNTFGKEWDLFKPTSVNLTPYWSTDFETGVGMVPTAFITAGALGALAWLLLFGALAWCAQELFDRSRHNHAQGIQAAVVTAGLMLSLLLVVSAPSITVALIAFAIFGLAAALQGGDETHVPSVHSLDAPKVRREFSLRLSPASVRGLLGIAVVFLFVAFSVDASLAESRMTVSNLIVQKAAAEYQRTGDAAKTGATIQYALSIAPENDTARRAAVELGLMEMQQDASAASSTALKAILASTIQQGLSAVSIDSSDYQNWLALAQLYQQLGGDGVSDAYPQALSAYQKAALANPTNPLLFLREGQVALAQQDASSSVEYLTKAIKLKGDLAASYYLRSQAYEQLQDATSAIADAKQSIALAPQDPLGWYNLGSILYAAHSYTDAVTVLSRALQLQPSYANALLLLSFSYEQLGQTDQAISAMQQLATLNPTDQNVQQMLARLQAGQSVDTKRSN